MRAHWALALIAVVAALSLAPSAGGAPGPSLDGGLGTGTTCEGESPDATAAGAPVEWTSVQAHSMIHTFSTPKPERERLMAAAKESGARIVRLDVEVHGIVEPAGNGYRYDFSKLDEVIELGRRHGIRILGILSGTPAGMADCPPGTDPEDAWKCAPADPEEYARHVVAIMEHAGSGVHAWEFWNEPDQGYMYTGSPEAYGQALGAIHRLSAGRFRITTGGVADLSTGLPFLRRAIEAGASFDIGNVHLRGEDLRGQAQRAARFFGDMPLWVTEHGYPSAPAPAEQMRHLRTSVPALREGGADQIFVTLRDIDEFGPESPFASEGILGKPAWDLVVKMNRGAAGLEGCQRSFQLYDNSFIDLSCVFKVAMCQLAPRTLAKRSTGWEQLLQPP